MLFKKRYIFRAILFLICGITVAICGIGAKHYYHLTVSNFRSHDNAEHSYNIYPGTTIDGVLNMLDEDYDIGSHQDFMLHARLMHFNYPEPGHYTFDSKISNRELIDRLRLGKQTPVNITWNNAVFTREQLAGKVTNNIMMDSVTLLQYLENDDFLKQYGLNKETCRCLFIPNTYQVFWTITPEQLFARMKFEYNAFWNDERRTKAEELGLTPIEVTIIASIIEGESRSKTELPIIASLYLNRVKKGMPLQACPTIKYAVGDFKLKRILYRHLAVDSPYNTYKNPGLPPGPIRCPNPQSIDYVLNAPKTNYLYMCANPALDGTHIFSSTYSNHAAAAAQYRHTMDTIQWN